MLPRPPRQRARWLRPRWLIALFIILLGTHASACVARAADLIETPVWLDAATLPVDEAPQALPPNEAPVRLAYYDATTQNPTLLAPGELTPLPPLGDQSQYLRMQTGREGILQYLGYSSTYIFGGAGDNIRFVDLGIKSIVALPAPSRESPLLLTPNFISHTITGPTSTDLPSRLYETFLDIRWLTQLTPRSVIDLGFTPGIYGDYAYVNNKTWRFQWRAIGVYTSSISTQLVAGVAFIDRENIHWLPVAGLIWTPSEVWYFDLVFPRPRISRQLAANWKREWRLYAAGEFGGNSFSILRTNGMQDVATYQDLRFSLGIERKKLRGRSFYLEAGLVFARKLEYASGTPSIEPGPSAMFQSGSYF